MSLEDCVDGEYYHITPKKVIAVRNTSGTRVATAYFMNQSDPTEIESYVGLYNKEQSKFFLYCDKGFGSVNDYEVYVRERSTYGHYMLGYGDIRYYKDRKRQSIYVTNLQEALSKRGYEVTINGIYDIETYNAVREFQFDNGLDVDGVAGNRVKGILFQEHIW